MKPTRTYDESLHPLAALRLAASGSDEKQISDALKISVETLRTWKSEHPVFARALEGNPDLIDASVEAALLKRATGFYYDETTFEKKTSGDDGKVTFAPVKKVRKYSPPEYSAIVFWLKQRKPSEWSGKKEREDERIAKFLEEMRHI